VNVAVTDRAASIVTTHSADPEQSPAHEVKTEPTAGVGVRVTLVPWS
jgi:hypothetical protein